jgi:hypothetical protein
LFFKDKQIGSSFILFFCVKAIAVTAVFRLVSTKVDPRQPLETGVIEEDDPLLLNR